jgi:hypothetical protein
MPTIAIVEDGLVVANMLEDVLADANYNVCGITRTIDFGILYATNNAGQSNLTKADGEARLGKPYRPDDVIRALKIVEEIVSTGQASEWVCHVWLVRAQTKLGKSGWGGHSSLQASKAWLRRHAMDAGGESDDGRR